MAIALTVIMCKSILGPKSHVSSLRQCRCKRCSCGNAACVNDVVHVAAMPLKVNAAMLLKVNAAMPLKVIAAMPLKVIARCHRHMS